MSLINLYSHFGQARIETCGGLVVSWQPEGLGEVLAMARQYDFADFNDRVHGGIPVCWPWAVYEGGTGCRIHGVVRYREWAVVSKTQTSLVLSLDDDVKTRQEWPHRFHAELKCSLGRSLEVDLAVTNTDVAAYACTELFHPYFRVGDIRNCTVSGTDGARYFWKPEADLGDQRIWKGDFPCKVFGGGTPGYVFEELSRVYTIKDPTFGRTIEVSYVGNCKLVVWGAGEDFAKTTKTDDPDFGMRFLCVEGGTLYRDRAYCLAPGVTHRLKLRVTVKGLRP